MCEKKCPSGKAPFYDECIDEIPNCRIYSNSKKCSKCEYSFELKEDGTCLKCPEEKSSDGFKCYNIIEKCYQQDEKKGTCFRCFPGYKPSKDGLSCEECESGKDENINSCLEYFENHCKYKSGTFYLYKQPDTKCSSCTTSEYHLTTNRQQCNIECKKGQYKFNGLCIDEIKNCVKYKSDKECEQCIFGYQIKNGACLPCVEPYEGSDGKTCHLQHFRCEHDDDYGNCVQCYIGYYLNSKKLCVKKTIDDDGENVNVNEDEDEDEDINKSFSLNLNLNIILPFLYGLLI